MNYEEEELEFINQQIDDLHNIKNIIIKIEFYGIFNSSILCTDVSKDYIDNLIQKIIDIIKKGNIDNLLEEEIDVLFPVCIDTFGWQVSLLDAIWINYTWSIIGPHSVTNNKSLFNSRDFDKISCNITKDYKDKTRLMFINRLISNLYDEYNETKKIFDEFNPYGPGAVKCKTHFKSLVKSQL